MSDRERESASAADAAAQAFFVPPSMLSSEAARDAGFYAAPTALGSIGRIDRFSILRTLGMGGMGIVALAIDANRGEEVAIKLLRPELRHDANAAHRFLREALHMQQLHHPHILRVLEIGTDPASPYYVMPYLPKGALSGMLIENKPLDAKTALAIATQAAQAIAHAHVHGIIHRDLKPSNVLLGSDGTAYVSDFGLLRTFYNDTVVNPENVHVEGTAPYMSPAVAAGEAEDTRCDIYAFGAMLYHMLTGRPPYAGSSSAQIIRRIIDQPPQPILRLNPVADRGLAAVAEGAMARSLRDRYAQMEDVVQDLRRLSTGRRPLGPRGGGGGVSRRRLLIVGGGLAGVMCVGGWVEWQRRRASAVPSVDRPPWHLPERPGGDEGEVFRVAAHDGIIRGVFLSDDERLAITTGDDGLIKCWDMQRRTCLRVFDPPHSKLWFQAHLSHDNALALTTGYQQNVILWDVATGKPIRSWPAGDLAPVAFSRDGKRLAYGATNSGYIARVCNADNNEIVREFPLPSGESGSHYLAFTADGRHLLIGGNEGSLRMMEIATGLATIDFGAAGAKISFVAVSPDGRLAASAAWNGYLRVWELATGQCVASVRLSQREAWEIRFLSDGRRLMAWTQDRTMFVLDLEKGAAGPAKNFSDSDLFAGVISHDGRHAVIVDPSGMLRLWRLPDPPSVALSIRSDTNIPASAANAPKERYRFAAHEGQTWGLVHHPRQPIVAVSAGENDLALWDLRTQKLIRRMGGHATRLIYVTFSADGTWVATTCKDQIVRLFETDTGELLRSWKLGTNWNDVAFSPDGRYIGMAGDQSPNLARIHNPRSGTVICDLAKSNAQVQLQHICRFTADGSGLLVADIGGTIKCLDIATGQFSYDLAGHQGEVSFIELTPDGRRAVSSGTDGTVRLWDLQQREAPVVLNLSNRPIWRAHFADEGKRILYWGDDRYIAKVDLESRQELWRIQSSVHVLFNADFSPDRRYVVIGEPVGGLRVWDLPA